MRFADGLGYGRAARLVRRGLLPRRVVGMARDRRGVGGPAVGLGRAERLGGDGGGRAGAGCAVDDDGRRRLDTAGGVDAYGGRYVVDFY